VNVPRIAGVILAAGASSRMGRPKALLEFAGETFIGRLASLLHDYCNSVIVVTGFDSGQVSAAAPAFAEIVVNPEPARGMLSSLQCALRAAEADAILFLPVDHGAVREDTVAAVAALAGAAEIIVPRFEGRHGHPVCISSAMAREILELRPEAQARDVIRSHRSGTRYVDVDDPAILRDIDTPGDYQQLLRAEQ
jgi:molybdenum cofactor cytidylyltransferase